MRYVVIMAGGSGTRLWPLSRRGAPKQLLALLDGKSLLRLAYERAVGCVPADRIWVVTGAKHAELVAEQLPEVPRGNILGEPVGRDSLAAAAWAAGVLHRVDPEAVIAQVSADQVIEPVEVFVEQLDLAFNLAEADPALLVTLGVVPSSPHTGYGYLHRGDPIPGRKGVNRVLDFTEKPALEVAQAYLASGEYWWNSGMFVWRAATFLDQLRILAPDLLQPILQLVEHPHLLAQIFPELPRNSIDYAVMEPVAAGQGSAEVVAVALPVNWRDVGGYASLAEILQADADGNSILGRVVSLDSVGNVVVNSQPDAVVGLLGVSGLVVVQTPGALLVARREDAERVKELVALITTTQGLEFA